MLVPVARDALAFPVDYPTLDRARDAIALVAREVGVLVGRPIRDADDAARAARAIVAEIASATGHT